MEDRNQKDSQREDHLEYLPFLPDSSCPSAIRQYGCLFLHIGLVPIPSTSECCHETRRRLLEGI